MEIHSPHSLQIFMILVIENLSKSYNGNLVFDNISLTVNKSECYCLVGKNGAGKSTLINIILNLLPQDSGNCTIFETTYSEDAHFIKKNIGVLPEFNPVIEEFSGEEYLKYVGYLYDLEEHIILNRISTLTDYFFEDPMNIYKLISQFSKGMKLKIGLCAALIHKPKFLILDEPFDGLDVSSSNKLVHFLNHYRNQGHTIFLSSHNMLYVEKVATHIGILNNSDLKYSLPLKDFLNGGKNNFEEWVSEILGHKSEKIIKFE